jgi:hypothetical protein
MTRYPLYRRLGGPQGRYGWVRKISPPSGFDPWTVEVMWDLRKPHDEKLHELSDQIKENEMVRACGMYKGDKKCT